MTDMERRLEMFKRRRNSIAIPYTRADQLELEMLEADIKELQRLVDREKVRTHEETKE